jgi:peptide/nickel transport system substrate-binding protein
MARWPGRAAAGHGPVQQPHRSTAPTWPSTRARLDKAKKLLAEAGYKGEPLKLLPLPYGESWQRQAEIVRQNLTQAGIKVELTGTDVAGWNQRLNEWDYDIAFTYVYQYGDPALGVARNYTSSNIAKGSPFNNVEGYSNSRVDALFAAGARATDPESRAKAYLEVQKLLSRKRRWPGCTRSTSPRCTAAR